MDSKIIFSVLVVSVLVLSLEAKPLVENIDETATVKNKPTDGDFSTAVAEKDVETNREDAALAVLPIEEVSATGTQTAGENPNSLDKFIKTVSDGKDKVVEVVKGWWSKIA
ncbi:uncharacterized protein LOC106641494 [Copidosoma floridanum]|uniref:uncharacterized protein LOC106641494 n=1 Tax=Copidosoma floridanum TaxID=29053 RepID=UPI0006C9E4FA|nr:uncharacterized protein LOC106641494 [Copidosoma floridanum]